MTSYTAGQEAEWQQWLAERPEHVRAVAERLRPDRPFKLVSSGQKVWVYSYGELADGSVELQVTIFRDDNPEAPQFHSIFPWQNCYGVFGVKPDQLVPWEDQ